MFNDDLWKKAEAAIDAAAPEAFAVSDWLGAHPEVGGEEFEAVKKHTDFLRAHGFDVTAPAFGVETAYHAKLGTGGRRVGLLAEYDALAGLGHGCGHNAHGAMTLLAAAGLRAVLGEVPGTVEVFGTPAEETYGGKVVMADRGAFDGLDFAMMIHCSGGTSGVPYRALACRGYEFTFEGKSAHAASAPWKGVNALNAVRILFNSLDMWRQHLRPEVRIMGIVTEGGDAPNIVPERATARFHLRAPEQDMEEDLIAKALDCARGAALCTGTKVSWKLFEEPFDCMNVNPAAERMVQAVFDSFGEPTVAAFPPSGSTDVGNVSWKCPALQPKLDITGGRYVAGHSHDFLAACTSPSVHPRILLGAKIIAKSALTVLTDDETAAAIRADFDAHRA